MVTYSFPNRRKRMSEEHKKKIGLANKGKTRSQEFRQKISEANKGRIISQQTREKISKSLQGRIPWDKGLTKETDQRIKRHSEIMKTKTHSIEWRQRMSDASKGNKNPFWGKKHSQETKDKISRGKLERKEKLGYVCIPLNPEARKKWGQQHSGEKSGMWSKKHSEKSKKQMSESRLQRKLKLGFLVSPETRKKISESLKRRSSSLSTQGKNYFSEEARRKLSIANKGSKNPMWGRKAQNSSHWLGGKSFEPYTIEFNKELKELIRHRDGYKCQKCGCPEIENSQKLTVHHIDYDKKNCLPSNLISLCNRCNFKVNSNRKKWTKFFQKKVKSIKSTSKLQLCFPK